MFLDSSFFKNTENLRILQTNKCKKIKNCLSKPLTWPMKDQTLMELLVKKYFQWRLNSEVQHFTKYIKVGDYISKNKLSRAVSKNRFPPLLTFMYFKKENIFNFEQKVTYSFEIQSRFLAFFLLWKLLFCRDRMWT